ncbi:MAG: aminotransferase class V-fold PLP-dependent enzyme [Planctomycetota bacterium]
MQARRIYLDNAATSFPKPASVHEAMLRYATEVGASPGRGAYAEARDGAAMLLRCRERLCALFGGHSPEHLIFTLNATDALNLAIKGIVAKRRVARVDRPVHVVTTAMDHNSVLRPFNRLMNDGEAEWSCVAADEATGLVEPAAVDAAIRDDTALVAAVHGSNVSGTLQPIEKIGEVCRSRGVPLLVDAAQSIGHVPIDVEAMGIDLLAFPGHKGLLGPLGTGALWIRPGLEEAMLPLREGGTGSRSEDDIQPSEMPDRFEPGSHNTVGIAGLLAGVEWLMDRGMDAIRAHEERLIATALAELPGEGDGYRLLGTREVDDRVGVFSLVHESLDADVIASQLEADHGVLTRAGLHCAPRAHATFGSLGTGAIRLSVGPFTTEDDVVTACRGLREVAAVVVR